MSARKKAPAKSGAGRKQAKRTHEAPIDQTEIKRAAERAGITTDDVQLKIPRLTPQQEAEQRAEGIARAKLVKAIAPDLALASEYLSEELAAYEDAGGGGDSSLIRSALHRVWQIRWNLGLYAGAPETVVRATTGGAS